MVLKTNTGQTPSSWPINHFVLTNLYVTIRHLCQRFKLSCSKKVLGWVLFVFHDLENCIGYYRAMVHKRQYGIVLLCTITGHIIAGIAHTYHDVCTHVFLVLHPVILAQFILLWSAIVTLLEIEVADKIVCGDGMYTFYYAVGWFVLLYTSRHHDVMSTWHTMSTVIRAILSLHDIPYLARVVWENIKSKFKFWYM